MLHLPAYWWQQQFVLTRRRVGPYGHALALGLHRREVLVAVALVAHHLLTLRLVRVQVVIDQPRRVVALQGEHDGQRVAQVVCREVVAQRLLALILAADHAASELHLRGVVEVDASHIVGEVVASGALEVAVIRKVVAVHHHLDGVVAGQHAEGERAVVLCL